MALIETPKADIGQTMPDFDLPDTEGKNHALTSLMGNNGLLVTFICNHCPYVQGIIDTFVLDANALKAQGINTVAIMSNDYTAYPDDSPEKMKTFIAQHNLPFPYLIDENQEIAKVYDAVCTPDFFGLDAKGALQYRGRLDNTNKGSFAGERTPELLEAMTLVAQTGKGPEQQIPSMGCSIKWK